MKANINRIIKRKQKELSKSNIEIMIKYQLIEKIYDDFKSAVIVIIIIAGFVLCFRWLVLIEYGSFEAWLNSTADKTYSCPDNIINNEE